MKCSKAFPLLVMKIPLLEYFATVSAKEFTLLSCSVALAEEFALLDEDKDYSQLCTLIDKSILKLLKFKIQQYLLNEHYALWEVIEFGDSYQAPPEESGKGSASESSAKKMGRTVAITTEDMQKRRNYVKVRTTLLLALPDEHLLRFSKVIGWCVPDTQSHGADPSTHVIIRGSSGLRRFFRYAMFIYSCYLCYVLSLYPFTERYAQPFFFSCFIRQIREEIREEFCTGSGLSNAGGNPPPVTIHTWLERFN
nr:hypothetical protein [Tanacetum cinerariifolium]